MEDMGSLLVRRCLGRHRAGDWGEIDHKNRQLNDLSLGEGGRWGFESAYTVEGGTVLRIFTFEDGSGTLLLTDKECQEEERALRVRALTECLAGQEGLTKEG